MVQGLKDSFSANCSKGFKRFQTMNMHHSNSFIKMNKSIQLHNFFYGLREKTLVGLKDHQHDPLTSPPTL